MGHPAVLLVDLAQLDGKKWGGLAVLHAGQHLPRLVGKAASLCWLAAALLAVHKACHGAEESVQAKQADQHQHGLSLTQLLGSKQQMPMQLHHHLSLVPHLHCGQHQECWGQWLAAWLLHQQLHLQLQESQLPSGWVVVEVGWL